ncbi:hypothetical protein ACFQVA_41640 [Actinomadura keratinilytica]
MLTAALSLAGMTAAGRTDFAFLVVIAFLLGSGSGLITPVLTTVLLGSLTPREAGAGSGVIYASTQFGSALGIGVVGAVFFGGLGGATGGTAPGELPPPPSTATPWAPPCCAPPRSSPWSRWPPAPCPAEGPSRPAIRRRSSAPLQAGPGPGERPGPHQAPRGRDRRKRGSPRTHECPPMPERRHGWRR